jgi:hypothetical protein
MKQSFLIRNRKDNRYHVIKSDKGFYGVHAICLQYGFDLVNAFPKIYANIWCDFHNKIIDRNELNLRLDNF